jgi:hypothetical protein
MKNEIKSKVSAEKCQALQTIYNATNVIKSERKNKD